MYTQMYISWKEGEELIINAYILCFLQPHLKANNIENLRLGCYTFASLQLSCINSILKTEMQIKRAVMHSLTANILL